jgi:hypothetical protein
MVQLGQTYKTDEIATGSSNNVLIADGWHKGVIVKSEMVQPLVQGKPDELLLTVVVTEGQYANTELEHRLSIGDETPIKADNPTFTWARAALGTIGQIAKALRLDEVSDTNALHNQPLMFETKTKEGKDKETGEIKPEWNRSMIYGYKAVSSVTQTAAPRAAAEPSANPTSVGAPAKPAPWANKA